MIERRRYRVGAVLLAGAAVAVLGTPAALAQPSGPTASCPVTAGGLTYLYVAERGAGAIGVYRSDSSGAATPVRTVIESGADGFPTDPWDVALDGHNRLYVQNYLSESATRVFAPLANGPTAPEREFRGFARDSPALAVGPDGTVYVARLQPAEVDIFPPGAGGQLDPAVLEVDGLPRSLTVDPAGDLVVAVEGRSAGNALEVFAPHSTGAATPQRTITGPATTLGRSDYFGGGEDVVITSSALTHRLYAAVTGAPADPAEAVPALDSHIAVFAEGIPTTAGSADVAPLRTIAGPDTGMTGTDLTGIADNPASGNVWVLAQTSGGLTGQVSTGEVLDYRRLADGDSAPIRSFTDATTHFADTQGIAFGTR
jgi:hypothetical protein